MLAYYVLNVDFALRMGGGSGDLRLLQSRIVLCYVLGCYVLLVLQARYPVNGKIVQVLAERQSDATFGQSLGYARACVFLRLCLDVSHPQVVQKASQ